MKRTRKRKRKQPGPARTKRHTYSQPNQRACVVRRLLFVRDVYLYFTSVDCSHIYIRVRPPPHTADFPQRTKKTKCKKRVPPFTQVRQRTRTQHNAPLRRTPHPETNKAKRTTSTLVSRISTSVCLFRPHELRCHTEQRKAPRDEQRPDKLLTAKWTTSPPPIPTPVLLRH